MKNTPSKLMSVIAAIIVCLSIATVYITATNHDSAKDSSNAVAKVVGDDTEPSSWYPNNTTSRTNSASGHGIPNTPKPITTTKKMTTKDSGEPYDGEKCGDNLYWSYDARTSTLRIYGTGSMYSYDDHYYTGYPSYSYIYGTTAPWRNYKDSIVNIIIDDTVESVGSYAFYNLTSVRNITVPLSLHYNYESFYRCNGIDNITLTNGTGTLDYYYYDYSNTPWYECGNSLTTVSFSDGVETIPERFLSGCKATTINLPNTLKCIGASAFSNCSRLSEIRIPNSVTEICDLAFYECNNLKNVNLGNSTELTLSYDVFNECPSIEKFYIGSANRNYYTDSRGVLYNKDKTGLIKYPASSTYTSYTVNSNVAYINEFAFDGSSNLTKVYLPNDIMSIGAYAFRNCTGLKEAVIPDGTITLCYSAFEGCTGIEKVVLPESLETLGGYSFRNCYNLNSVVFNCINCNEITSNRSPFDGAGKETDGLSITFSDSVKSIPGGLFYFRESYYYWGEPDYNDFYLKEVTIGKNVKNNSSDNWYRYYGSFYKIQSLETVNYNAINCSDITFNNCENLVNLNIGNGVKTIPEGFVKGCTSLDSVTLPSSVTRIMRDAFTDTALLNDESNWENNALYIGNNLIKVNENVSGDYAVKSNVVVIADDAFNKCVNINKVSMPSSVVTIGEECFRDCTNLNEISIPSGVKYIGGGAFYMCDNLSTVYYNAVNCDYAADAFNGASIGKFIIANTVKSLPDAVLYQCENVNEVMIPESIISIGKDAFGYNSINKLVFYRTDRIDFSGPMFNYLDKSKVIYCKENSFMHSYAEMNSLTFCIFNDSNDNFRIANDVIESYEGSSSTVFVNAASKIGFGAFENNKSVKNIEISSVVTRIFNSAFKNCSNLSKVIIPQSVTSIGNDAFSGCSKLTIWCYAGSYAESYAKAHGIPVQYITLSVSEATVNMLSSETVQLSASFNTSILDNDELVWTSDNPDVVAVTSDGKITAVGKGEATITATSKTGLYATCKVYVDMPVTTTLGDINGDGNINSSDALLVLQHSVQQITLSAEQQTVADVNKDSKVNSTDALMILQYTVGQISKF